MGVHGLWKLLEPSGQMVPLESLAGKTIAVDVSIWLHQAIKGMQDTYGAPVETAHLVILFHRLCKLLFYKIKPVFVFDGGIPALKHQTMTARRRNTTAAKSEVLKVREKLIKNLLKHEAVRQVLSNETASVALGLNSFALPGPSVEEDLYKLPPIAADYAENMSSEDIEDEEEEEEEVKDKLLANIYSLDVSSEEFLKLSPEVRHDILTELIETRKQSSWKYLASMPSDSDSFSNFQMDRLLKRKAVQASLEKAGKEMGGRALSLKELESMLSEKGVIENTLLPGKRIAQDNITRYMLVKKDLSELESKEGGGRSEFNIMDRLDEVEWSSDSDTDVILEKSDKLRRVKLENDKPKAITMSIKSMDKEVVDILNVLEDDCIKVKPYLTEPVSPKTESVHIKLKSPKSESDFEASEMQKLPTKYYETKNERKVVKISNNDFCNTEIPVNNPEKEKVNFDENTLKASAVVTPKREDDPIDLLTETFQEKNSEINCFDDAQFIDENSTEILSFSKNQAVREEILKLENFRMEGKNNNLKEMESDSIIRLKFEENPEVVKIDKESNVKSLKSPQVQKLKEVKVSEMEIQELRKENSVISESSGDSEDDFVSINVPEASNEQVKPEIPKSAADQSKEKPKTDTSQSLMITVIPTEINVGDDIFADVFQPASESKLIEETSENSTEKITEDVNEFDKEMTSEELKDLQKSLEEKQFNLMMEKGKQERQALNPTEQMYEDAQELLRLFGVPFVIAPMEAEAQCACLDNLGLTEGTITDDSDIWLFGGRVVYKNFFNQKKHVMEYRAANIQKHFKLNRDDLIRMAMLVGSDYTTGLNGIGPVTALEILASFPSSEDSLFDGLERFRDWFTGQNSMATPRTSLKRKIRNTIISPGFPNKAVADAYLFPQVDDSKEPFSWAKPNVELIRKYVKIKIGWSSEKCSNLLLPVLKKMEEKKGQSVMEKYFHGAPNAVGILSKRVEEAIKRLKGNAEKDKKGEEEKVDICLNKKRKVKKEEGEIKRKKRGHQKKDTGADEKPEEDCLPNTTFLSQVTLPQQQLQSSSVKSKDLLIKEKLHREEKIPQKEKTQKMLDERKKEAIEIFRTFKRKRKKIKVFAKKEANLSESSSKSDDDND